jgi:hypothetical protein
LIRAVKWLSAAETHDQVGIDLQSLGNGTAFSAVAPSSSVKKPI